jgi:hypothetical protein
VDADNVIELVAVPVTTGETVFAGRARAATTVVEADHFVTAAASFVAVTEATMNFVASAVTNK